MPKSEQYWFVFKTDVLRLAPSRKYPGEWTLSLNDQPLPDRYSSAEEAAEKANRKDFEDENVIRLIRFSVPQDLDRWNTIESKEPDGWSTAGAS